jgi:5-methylcytosine-specific restriction protein B
MVFQICSLNNRGRATGQRSHCEMGAAASEGKVGRWRRDVDETGFRSWLQVRNVTSPLSDSSIENRLSRVRRFERRLADFGLDHGDLDEAHAADGLAGALAALKRAEAEAEKGVRPPAALIPHSDNPANQLRNFLSAVRNYRQYLDEKSGVTARSDWPQLEEMRLAFLERAPDFEHFEQREGTYWETERGYKDDLLDAFRELAGSDASDEEAGGEIYHVLCTGAGAPLFWRTSNRIERERPPLVPDFRKTVGRLARDKRRLSEAMEDAAAALQALRAAGAESLSRGEILAIVLTIAGFARPLESAPFKVEKANRLATLLEGHPIFQSKSFDGAEADRYLALLAKMFAVMRDVWSWRPRDLFDVQGFAWAVLDPRWAAPADDGEAGEEAEDSASYWLVGAAYGGTDNQLDRFLAEGIWDVSSPTDRQRDQVLAMRPGERIAIKSAFRQRRNLPFDNRGHDVSVNRIKARGVIAANPGDGEQLLVDWEEGFEPRDWYFYTNRETIWNVRPDSAEARALIRFAFEDAPQDYDWWRNHPTWTDRFGDAPAATPNEPKTAVGEAVPYGVDDIMGEGCFLDPQWIEETLEQLRHKKNLVLQGPPGTGKTWLAKRLGYALLGERDSTRLTAIQFHPSLSYEDFVRGYRPDGDGRLTLADGLFLQVVEAAGERPDRDFVLVIEEINRGNPSQIFGELLTLLECDKRGPAEAMKLAYVHYPEERVHVPPNLHIIGTMNLADRSLALVDLALRRRFAFRTLAPTLNGRWRTWCEGRCGFSAAETELVAARLNELNDTIAEDRALGEQFRIGHSYVTPPGDVEVADVLAWFRQAVETEIGPLLDEYWYDAEGKAREARAALLREP